MKESSSKLLELLGIETNHQELLNWVIAIAGTILLFFGSRFICRTIIIPMTKALTKKTASKWDDIILNERNFTI